MSTETLQAVIAEMRAYARDECPPIQARMQQWANRLATLHTEPSAICKTCGQTFRHVSLWEPGLSDSAGASNTAHPQSGSQVHC